MSKLTRRKFIARTGTGVAALQATSAFRGASAPAGPARKFYAVLSLGRIGFNGTFEQSVELAHKYGFEGIDPDADLFARLSDADLKHIARASNLRQKLVGEKLLIPPAPDLQRSPDRDARDTGDGEATTRREG